MIFTDRSFSQATPTVNRFTTARHYRPFQSNNIQASAGWLIRFVDKRVGGR